MEPAKEVRIVGSISHVYVDEQDPSVRGLESEEPSPSTGGSGKPTKNYVIVPIKDQKSKVTFIKVPIFKLSKAPKAEKVGVVNCRQLGPGEEEPEELEVQKWCADKIEINQPKKSKQVKKTDSKPKELEKTDSKPKELEKTDSKPKELEKTDSKPKELERTDRKSSDVQTYDYKTIYISHHTYPLEPVSHIEQLKPLRAEESDRFFPSVDSVKSYKEQKKKKEKKESKKDSRRETKESSRKNESIQSQASEKETNQTQQEESKKRWPASITEGPSTPPNVLSYLVTSKEKQQKKKFL